MTRPSRTKTLCASLALLALGACGDASNPSRPDVVLIVLDTTRADRLGPFGDGQAAATPFLDELGAQSVVFENAWTGSTWTGPSSATVFSGLFPPRHGLVQNLWAQVGVGRKERADENLRNYMAEVDLIALPTAVPTLPEHLEAAGYQTVGVATNPNLCEDFGFTRGFAAFRNLGDVDAADAVDALLALARPLDATKPRFLFLHLNDPHVPYQSRKPWCPHGEGASCSNACKYASEISYLDGQLRRLFTSVPVSPDAIVVLVNDHGEEFHDHGDIGHRYSVHQELARAALLVRAPGVAPRRSELPAHHVDILPTVLERLRIAPPPEHDGVPLIPSLDDASLAERPLLTHRIGGKDGRVLWGLTVGRWRLIEETPNGVLQLYDRATDPDEQIDLAAAEPEQLARMQALLSELRDGLQPLPPAHVRVDMTDELTDELLKLGYAGDQH